MSNALQSSQVMARDLRLDFVRGLALYMILIDHVSADPFSRLTFHSVGFSDAAEIFVLVSGISCGLVYHRLLQRTGWLGFLSTIVGRGFRICVYFLLTGLATLALVKATKLAFGIDYLPPRPGILLLYLPLTLIAMPLFFLGARHGVVAALCVSGAGWLIAQLFPHFGSAITDWTWLNPLAWQFLFVIGLFFGIRYSYPNAASPTFRRMGWLVALAWAVVVGSFLYRFSLFVAPRLGFDLEWIRLSTPTIEHFKETLAPPRLLHILSAALVFVTCVRMNHPFLQWAVAKPFIVAGQRSLEMFSISVILSEAANIYVQEANPSVGSHLILDCIIISAMVFSATLIARLTRGAERAEPIAHWLPSWRMLLGMK